MLLMDNTVYVQCLPYIIGYAHRDDPFLGDLSLAGLVQDAPLDGNAKTTVHILETRVETFSISDTASYQPDIEVVVQLSWIDPRLKWNTQDWKFRRFPTDPLIHTKIWGPTVQPRTGDSRMVLPDVFSYENTDLWYNGSITTDAVMHAGFGSCSANMQNFPYDQMTCCVDFDYSPYGKVYFDTSSAVSTWGAQAAGAWQVKSISWEPRHSTKKPPANRDYMQMCVKATRNTATLGLELSLPMAVSAIVMMCAQLAGKWKMQVYIKLFALFLQTVAFQGLFQNATLKVATSLPRIYVFYNFTVGITLFSLIQTLLFWALTRRWFIMPPPHGLFLTVTSVSKTILGKGKHDRAGEVDLYGEKEKQAEKSYQREWEVVFLTMHAVLSLALIVAYLIGIIVVYA